MSSKPPRKSELLLIALMMPILGIFFGGIYSYPAQRLTGGRDPWHTMLLGLGLAVTVFGIGYPTGASPATLGLVWLGSIGLLLLVRAAFGLSGNFEHYGFAHLGTLLILLFVLAFTRHHSA